MSMRRLFSGAIGLLAVAGSGARAAAAYDWPQFNGNARHTGLNTSEVVLSPGNVGQLQQLFQVTLPAVADDAPAVLTAVPTAGGVKDLLFVNTKQGTLIALDAHTGGTVWTFSHGNTGCAGGGGGACVTESSPAVDPGRGYVYSYGLDGAVHKHDVGTGAESTGGGWPAVATLKPDFEKASSALTVATDSSGTSHLYVTNSGYIGDGGDYQGHVTAIDLANGAQSLFNGLCSSQAVHFVRPGTPDCPSVQAGIWARAGAVYDADIDRIFVVTGNGHFASSSGDWGDSVLELNPNGTGAAGAPVDSYTPANFQALQNADVDLGSTAPLILPTPPGFPYPHIAAQSGKDGIVRLLNLDNLSNQGSGPEPGRTGGELATFQLPSAVLTAPAAWVNPADGTTWLFVVTGTKTFAFQLTANGSSVALASMWTVSSGGASPIVANNVLYVAGQSAIQALAPATGAPLWHASIGGIHWESPVVANGVLYVLDESAHLTAFTVPSSAVPALPSGTVGLTAALLLLLALFARWPPVASSSRGRRPQ